ncbi:GNAT family N-acetyltransferase [Flammeovirga agarivorans]|uniref:GNAT family N-acetyltransferase n=1 Tax=Flammeovirga agarivorans TaxID=2726742 RepID=A0A7X8SJ94_9BACT|nr:GNAT family N-acetyltransferase [Flammeovirga agarivorans]NLR91152.1 GNAT family N-acetyltransferase [Flammeovirga agarivorans]
MLLKEKDNLMFYLSEQLNPFEINDLFQLWNSVYPMQLAYKDLDCIREYLTALHHKKHILVKTPTNKVIGWFFSFERDGERWFAILINNEYKRKGLGSDLIKLAKKQFAPLNGWVIDHERYYRLDGEKYVSPLAFYLRHGFRIATDVRLEIPTLSAVKIHYP